MQSKFVLLLIFCFSAIPSAFNQITIKGRVIDSISEGPLAGVRVRLKANSRMILTDREGFFSMAVELKQTNTMRYELKGFATKEIEFKDAQGKQMLDLGTIKMLAKYKNNMNEAMIEMSDEGFDADNFDINNISGLLSSRKDVFSRTTAFDFSSNFFRRRFLGSEQGLVMLNGVRLNKVLSGRPEWSNWGGLNDALRRQEVFREMRPTDYALGGMAKSINMLSSSMIQRKGMKVSIAAANKNYSHRSMITYASGLFKEKWSFMLSASLRNAASGFRQGTNYQANSFLISIDRNMGQKHHFNLSYIFAQNQRGKSSPLTDEVFELKDNSYNSYWGYQSGKKRNSRVKKILEPILQLNYYFKPNPLWSFDAHVTYQKGKISSSRLDFSGTSLLGNFYTTVGGGSNPDATYYQKLPSYFLRSSTNTDYSKAFLAEKEFKNKGQIDWNSLYEANLNQPEGRNSIYALYEDVEESENISFQSSFSTTLNTNFKLSGSFFLRSFKAQNYAFMTDLLGGTGYLDIDSFSDDLHVAQNNLAYPNRIVGENERFRYNYELGSLEFRTHAAMHYMSKKSEAYCGIEISSQNYQRNGLYENGRNPGSLSFGESKPIHFFNKRIKMGYSYRISGRHIVSINVNHLEDTPVLKDIFTNVRESNNLVPGLRNKISSGFDINYTWRHPVFYASLSGYYVNISDATNLSFYYADGLIGLENNERSAYVQEVLTGIDKLHSGVEFALEAKVYSGVKLKAVGALGYAVYTSDPNLYLSSNSIDHSLNLGPARLRNYFSSSGPQNAFSAGFEYSSPKYWWLSASVNVFENSFISVAPISRTKNFYLDTDGLLMGEVDPEKAQMLLKQESLDAYWTLNLVGGKSWKIKNFYLGFFVSINNLLNSVYKTGGFEQSRNANYWSLLEDKIREKPLFGPKYWFSYGSTFFTSIYIRL